MEKKSLNNYFETYNKCYDNVRRNFNRLNDKNTYLHQYYNPS